MQPQEEGDSAAEQALEEALEEALQAVESPEGVPLEEEEEEEIEDGLYDHEGEQTLHNMLQQQEEQLAAAGLQALQGHTGPGDAAPAARVQKTADGGLQDLLGDLHRRCQVTRQRAP